MEKSNLAWKRMRFKNNKVWLATGPDGKALVQNGKVLIKYQLDQDYEYWVHPQAVKPLATPAADSRHPTPARSTPDALPRPQTAADGAASKPAIPPDAICIFTDGASSGNPGPSGIGVLLRYGGRDKEISKFIGTATNNIAELKAIQTGLETVKNRQLPVRIFTDSNYAYGVLALGWQAQKNQEMVEAIRREISQFRDLQIIKVKGHAGVPENERVDFLATAAIKKAVNAK
ncbi:MAG: ribonuclease HI [Desulfobacterales bacterium]|nr:MAG: ribonuclease HI [Desulfobacterales bacterium]